MMAIFTLCLRCGHRYAQHSLSMQGCTECACAEYTTVVGPFYPEMPPAIPGETADEYTDRLTGADKTDRRPYDHKRNRQCSIGYHDECSDNGRDPSEHTCECPHHTDPHYRSISEQDQDRICSEIERLVKNAIYDARNAKSTIDAGARDAAERIVAMLVEEEYL